MKGYKLESVGTYLRADGMTYPLGRWDSTIAITSAVDGSYDPDNGTSVFDIEPDGDWMTNLSDDDRKIVESVLNKQEVS